MTSNLSGKRILVTRSRKQAGRLAAELEEKGAIPIILPTSEIQEPENWDHLDQALRNLEDFDWVIFTSANAVEAVSHRMAELGLDPENLRARKLAVVGPTTGDTMRQFFRSPDAMPNAFVASAIGECLGDLEGKRVLLPRGDLARPDLPLMLNAAGATVLEVIAYCAVPIDDAIALSLSDRPDAITFASAESVRRAVAKLRQAGIADWLSQIPIACIGPVTAEAVREFGLIPAAVAEEFTLEGLIKALENMFGAVSIA
jgi:uroporphyrinogen-III synthase